MPAVEYALLIRLCGTQAFAHARQILTEQLGGAPLVVPSSVADVLSEELRPMLDKYYRGSTGSALDRIQLFKLIWDAVGSEFGSRHAWYEVNYSGNQEQIRLDTLRFAGMRGITASQQEMVDRCLAEYDPDGWRDPTWLS